MRRPSKKSFIVLGVVGLLVLAGSTAQAGWLFVLAAGVAGLVGGSILLPQRLGSFELTRDLPARAVAGHDVAVTIGVRNTSRRSLPLARIEDLFLGLEEASYVSERLAGGGSSEARSMRRASRRGVFEGGEMRLRSGTPFGFVVASKRVAVASKMVVVPSWVELSSFPILEPASAPHDVLHERARTGAGEEYLGVRAYRPGDPKRFVHWRSSARAGTLVVREFEEHIHAPVSLVVAGADAGTAPDSAFEAIVRAAASIGDYALRTGHPIQIVMAGDEGIRSVVRPGRGGMLQWLAEAQAGDADLGPLVSAGARGAGRRGTVVLLVTSAGLAPQSLIAALHAVQGAGARAVAVIADASTWAPDGAPTPGPFRVPVDRSIVRLIRRGEDLRSCLQA